MMDSQAGVDALVETWVSRFRVPSAITSDRGRQFCFELWTRLCCHLGVQHITTTAYHPQSNEMVERVHRQLKDSLRARLAGNKWPEHLPWVLLGLRAAPKDESGLSSAELVYGIPLTLPGQLLSSSEPPATAFRDQLRAIRLPPTRAMSYAEAAATVPAILLAAKYVYIRKGGVWPPLAPLYQGPYAVVQSRPKCFKVQIGDKVEVVSVDRLKPNLGTQPLEPVAPVARGRPRREPARLAAIISPVGGPASPAAVPPPPRPGGLLWRQPRCPGVSRKNPPESL
jgi:hypothetical protein